MFDLEKLWGQFERPFKEVEQARLYKHPENKGYILVLNATGISNDKIKVEFKEATSTTYPIVVVTGEQTHEYSKKTYSINYSAAIRIKEEIEDIVYDCKDGLCTIFFKTKQQEDKETVFARPLTSDFKW